MTKEEEVDVAHEALIRGWPRLRQWIDDDRSGLRIHRRITESAEEWRRLKRDKGLLFRGALLAQAQEWRVQCEAGLNALEREFLDASVKLKMSEEEEEKVNQLRAKKLIWVRWTLATIVGTVGGIVLGGVAVGVAVNVARAVLQEDEVIIVGVAVAGAVLGFAQWLVLRQQFNQAGWWIAATAVGVAVLVVAGVSLLYQGNELMIVPVLGVGTILGFAQWLVLRQQFNQADTWIAATAVGVAAAWYGTRTVFSSADATNATIGPSVLAVGAAGLVLGAITGRLLIWLLQRPISKMVEDEN